MTDQQAAALTQVPGLTVIAQAIRSRSLIVSVSDGRLYRLSPGGLLYRISERRRAA